MIATRENRVRARPVEDRQPGATRDHGSIHETIDRECSQMDSRSINPGIVEHAMINESSWIDPRNGITIDTIPVK